MHKSTFRRDIEGMRALSILAVLAYHAGLPFYGGYIGVDVFFVISGYLITTLLLSEAESNGSISLLGFYGRRFRRLLPAATLVLLVALAATLCFAPGSQKSVFSWDVVAAAGYAVNWRFAARSVDYLLEDVGRSPVLHFWSLAVEEQFYLVWPLLILAALVVSRKTGMPWRRAVVIALLLVLVPSFAWSISYTQSHAQEAFFVTTTRLWELAIGALLAALPPGMRQLRRPLATGLTWAGLCLFAYSLWGLNNSVPWPGFRALLPVASAALLILGGGAAEPPAVTRWLGSRVLMEVGKLSYSLYLWHWPIIVVGQDWLGLVGLPWGLALVVASFVPAWVSHRWVEMPIRSSRVLAERPALALSGGANLSLLSVAAGLLAVALPVTGTETAPTDGATDTAANPAVNPIRLSAEGNRVVATPAQLGAGALGSNPRTSAAGQARSEHAKIFPAPDQAVDDMPEGYAKGCQVSKASTKPIWCEIGDPDGKTQVVAAGDSKLLQYYEALDIAGRALGWKIRTTTKSGCPFVAADVSLKGEVYSECRQFNQTLLGALEKDPPDVLLTSQLADTALVDAGSDKRTAEAMIDGLVRVWKPLTTLGTRVVALLDNPRPPAKHLVYDCVAKHPKDYASCAFERDKAIATSAAATQRAAAARLAGVSVLDLTDYICPSKQCAPVIGDILVYRQSSHITNTYARSLAPVLTQELAKIPLTDARRP